MCACEPRDEDLERAIRRAGEGAGHAARDRDPERVAQEGRVLHGRDPLFSGDADRDRTAIVDQPCQPRCRVALRPGDHLVFALTAVRRRLRDSSWAMAVVFLGIMWIGMALAHAMLLRRLPHGGGLLLDTLVGTFLGDTGAYFGGRLWGRTKLSPRISPNKTVEGLIAGIIVGTFAFWASGLYQNWLNGIDALVIGLAVALTAPLGDLFESLIKRDSGVKDSGRIFGAHGGVLDRLDAVLFTVVAAYYVALAVL